MNPDDNDAWKLHVLANHQSSAPAGDGADADESSSLLVGPAALPSSQVQIAELPTGWQMLSLGMVADDTLAVLGAPYGDLENEHRRRIWTATSTGWTDGPAFSLEPSFALSSYLGRFSDGRWLVVGARTDGDANAQVIGADGAMLDRFMLGDGIMHVAIDADDRIWVGWFDEGVFGNEGWKLLGQEWPPSSNGVACFADDGTVLPELTWPEDVERTIADCYALTVLKRGVWTCTYTDFPLVRFVPGEPTRWWRSGLAGPNAIAIGGSHALVAGGYRDEANRLVLLSLDGAGEGEAARQVASWRLPMRPATPIGARGRVWEPPSLLVGRCDVLHMIYDDIWYRWRVADLI